jgi:hypothetical protein
VPQPPLNRPGVVPPIGQRVAAGVAEHVRVRFSALGQDHDAPSARSSERNPQS